MAGITWPRLQPADNRSSRCRIHYDDPILIPGLSAALTQMLQDLDPGGKRPIVVVAIGTDRSTGDSLGPLTGSKLKELAPELTIYGTLEEPIHAGNLVQVLQEIEAMASRPLVIAIDACLGQSQNVGCITLAPGPLKPGAGVNKELPSIGDLHFTGIVNVGGYMEYFVLQNTRLSLVKRMADQIACCIYQGVEERQSMSRVASMVQ